MLFAGELGISTSCELCYECSESGECCLQASWVFEHHVNCVMNVVSQGSVVCRRVGYLNIV